MTSKLVEKIRNVVFPILGVFFILFSDHVTRILPYLLGGAMVLTAILWGINAFQNRNLALEHPEGFTSGIVTNWKQNWTHTSAKQFGLWWKEKFPVQCSISRINYMRLQSQ